MGETYGFWSLLPAIVTLGVAFASRQVLPALVAGVGSGSLVVFGHSGNLGDLNPLTMFVVPAVGTPEFAWIVVYFWSLGGILGLWKRTGATRHFAETLGPRIAKDRIGAKVYVWLLGGVFHQGGTISTILAGTTAKPIADRHRVSHEELAFLVDSTASPIATVVPFSAWPLTVGGIIVGVGVGDYVLAETADDAVRVFVESIPFNFYAWMALLIALLLAVERLPWTGAPMAQAIERAKRTGELDSPEARPWPSFTPTGGGASDGVAYRVGLADFLAPLGALLLIAIGPYFLWGHIAMGEAALTAALVSLGLSRVKGLPTDAVVRAFVDGASGMTLGAILIALAMSLAAVSKHLGAAEFLVATFSHHVLPWMLPAVLMLLCMATSFSVGSSFGTYAVVFPIAIPLVLNVAFQAYASGVRPADVADFIQTSPAQWKNVTLYVHVCFGAVMGGSVFGDQCSPVSDTTILSSMFTGCDVMDHVRTQLPLALLAAAIAVTVSTVLVAMI